MNFKALITTLVLGSSTMASADTFSASASASVSLGFHTSSAPVIVRDHRTPAPAPAPVVVVADPCATPAPAPAPAPVYYPQAQSLPATRPVLNYPPTWQGPSYYNITNTNVGSTASEYRGWVANSPVQMQQVSSYGHVVLRPTRTASWFDLTEATRIDSNREFFTIGADNGWFSQLKLDNLGTRGSKITQVAIQFADNLGSGKTQVVKLNQTLNAAHPSITIDLEGNYRQIGRIIVYGSTNQGAAYKISAK